MLTGEQVRVMLLTGQPCWHQLRPFLRPNHALLTHRRWTSSASAKRKKQSLNGGTVNELEKLTSYFDVRIEAVERHATESELVKDHVTRLHDENAPEESEMIPS